MSDGNPDKEANVDWTSSGLEEDGDTATKKPLNTGSRLWDWVRSSLLKQKVEGEEVN